jgi:hypothetical protein
MKYAIAGIGFVGFAAVSLLHVATVYQVVKFYAPGSHWIAAVGAGLVWLAFVVLVFRGMHQNRLWLPMAVVFCYGMVVALAGMAVLDGVPSAIDEGTWSDPHHVLKPGTKYVLHNHSVVKKALSKDQYDLYLAYGLAYFSGIGMVFGAAASLGPLDHDGQVFKRRRPRASAATYNIARQ